RNSAEPGDPALLLTPILMGSEHTAASEGDRFDRVVFCVCVEVQVSGRLASSIRFFPFYRKRFIHALWKPSEVVAQCLLLQWSIWDTIHLVARRIQERRVSIRSTSGL